MTLIKSQHTTIASAPRRITAGQERKRKRNHGMKRSNEMELNEKENGMQDDGAKGDKDTARGWGKE